MIIPFNFPRLKYALNGINSDIFNIINVDNSPSTTAGRVNHMCCIFSALAAAFIAISIDKGLGKGHPFGRAASWLGSGLFAFSPCKHQHGLIAILI